MSRAAGLFGKILRIFSNFLYFPPLKFGAKNFCDY